MNRDYGSNYDHELVDCVYEEIDCSIFDISFLIEFLPFHPHNPIQDCLDQLFDIHSLEFDYSTPIECSSALCNTKLHLENYLDYDNWSKQSWMGL
jgi:hypothetical protein